MLTGLPLSTVHRLVTELTSFGVLERTEEAWYRVGARLATIGGKAPTGGRIPRPASWLQIVRRVMEDISAATGTCVRFGVLESLRVAFIEKPVDGDGSSDFAGAVEWAGALPAHATALGKALLAFSLPDVVDGVIAHGLKRYTPTTLTDPDRLRHSLKEVRLTGVASPTRRCLRPFRRSPRPSSPQAASWSPPWSCGCGTSPLIMIVSGRHFSWRPEASPGSFRTPRPTPGAGSRRSGDHLLRPVRRRPESVAVAGCDGPGAALMGDSHGRHANGGGQAVDVRVGAGDSSCSRVQTIAPREVPATRFA